MVVNYGCNFVVIVIIIIIIIYLFYRIGVAMLGLIILIN